MDRAPRALGSAALDLPGNAHARPRIPWPTQGAPGEYVRRKIAGPAGHAGQAGLGGTDQPETCWLDGIVCARANEPELMNNDNRLLAGILVGHRHV